MGCGRSDLAQDRADWRVVRPDLGRALEATRSRAFRADAPMKPIWALLRRAIHCAVTFHRMETHYDLDHMNSPVVWIGCECGRSFWGEKWRGITLLEFKRRHHL